MDSVTLDYRMMIPECADAATGFHFGGELVEDLQVCECGFHEVRFGFSVVDGELFGFIGCPVCGFAPDDQDFDPVASSWLQALCFLFVAWNEALGVSAPRVLPEYVGLLADCVEVSVGPLPEWRARKCRSH